MRESMITAETQRRRGKSGSWTGLAAVGSSQRLCVSAVNHSENGITLVEMLVVVAIIGIMAGLAFPSVAAGIDSVRLRSATDSVATILNAAVDRADRHQVPVELVIAPKDNSILLLSNEPGFTRQLKMPQGITLVGVLPKDTDNPDVPLRLVLMPGNTVPGIGVELANGHGARRIVRLDPMTGFPRVESVKQE